MDAEGGMILPNLAECITKLQDMLRPEDEKFGKGIADWTITAEYVDGLTIDGEPVWGCMGSPSTKGLTKLTPEDIAARRAHMALRTPRTAAELAELWRTLFHEGGHVLVAELDLPRDAEEEVMHSLDHAFSKLSPEQASALARGIRNPMARAYRAPAKEGDMPEDKKDEKEPDKPTMQADKPAMQEGGSIEDIEKALVAAKLAGDDAKVGELMNAWIAAKVAGASAAGPASAPEVPTMGMKPEEAAYARKSAEDRREAIEAILEANPHLDDKQKAMARKQSSVKDARELVASYGRPSTVATMGMKDNPKKDGPAGEKPLARAMREAASPRVRKVLGLGSLERDGVHVEPGGGILIYIDGTEQLNHQKAAYAARRSA